MKTLLLRDGDLVVSRRDYRTVTGTGKLAQDLRGALAEPLGNDRFHTGWGSTLEQFIGLLIDPYTEVDIRSEVNRVIGNYASVQRDKVEADVNGDGDSRFTTSDLVDRIEQVLVGSTYDTVNIGIRLRAVSGEVVVLNEAVA